MAVPFLDLRAQYLSLRGDIDAAIQGIVDRTAFIGGEAIQQFEREFAAFCGAQACAGVGNGTDALQLVLEAMGIGPGDEVITVPNTFMATAEAITRSGATLRLCDVRPDTHLMDPEALARAITPKTKAVIPVHLFGQTCDMDAITAIARAHGLRIIEDAAQAHGAELRGRRPGTLGDAACFSFYPGKNLGAYGDAGAVVSNDAGLTSAVRCLANHGRASHTEHARIGTNSRLDGIQAAVLRAKLPHLNGWNQARRAAAKRYDPLLAEIGATPVTEAPGCTSVYHLYVVEVDDREGLMAHLRARDIGCGLHYRTPVHLTEAYRGLGLRPGAFPVAERLQSRIISLPIFPEITEAQQAEVVEAVAEFVGAPARG
ncbi:MAG: DegT/DnrJ/EryC1/StrS family aminotransferase [Candidatus Sumerlaeia bacterium]|nr:DegT/DnrJ/EryC1/StrS family aminotransferase [Candidatus Sumerlaeia bacterium]